jgi:hypothetical protein
VLTGFGTEFVVAAPKVLHERVTAHDYVCAVVVFEASHRAESGFEAAVVGFDPVVRVLRRTPPLSVGERRRTPGG